MRSPEWKSKAAIAWAKAVVAFWVRAMFRPRAPMSAPTPSLAPRIWSALASAVS